MNRLLQINVTANWGSTGRIAEWIGDTAIRDGWDSTIAYGRGMPTSSSHLIKIGTPVGTALHGLQTRLFDRHGLASKGATKRLTHILDTLNPDIIHLHNIHGYYINYPELFRWLERWGGPVVWTLHDCWPFTGHCSYYDMAACDRWQTECHDCPQKRDYPASLLFDRSRKNHRLKKEIFGTPSRLNLVPVSDWLAGELKKSFLKNIPTETIKNGIDTRLFSPSASTDTHKGGEYVLGAASIWGKSKGLEEFIKLRSILPAQTAIKLVGLSESQIRSLPPGIEGLPRTENTEELCSLYSNALAFINPTFEDTFPTTNLEALACGTPVITYRTGGSPEAITPATGIVVSQGDIRSLAEAIGQIRNTPNRFSREECRRHAVANFNKDTCYRRYTDLYSRLLQKE